MKYVRVISSCYHTMFCKNGT